MVVPTHCDAWIVIADHYQAHLLGCTATPTGRCHLTRYGAIESPIPDIEFGRPNPLAGMNGHTYAQRHQRLEEEYRRFARQLANWINRCIERFGIGQLTACIPERSHRDVIAHLRHDYRDRVALRGENLLQLSPDALSKHQLITSLLHPHKQNRSPGAAARLPHTTATQPPHKEPHHVALNL